MAQQQNRGRGRPPFPDGEARDLGIRIRVNEDEKRKLELAAGRAGQSLADFLRSLGLKRAQRYWKGLGRV